MTEIAVARGGGGRGRSVARVTDNHRGSAGARFRVDRPRVTGVAHSPPREVPLVSEVVGQRGSIDLRRIEESVAVGAGGERARTGSQSAGFGQDGAGSALPAGGRRSGRGVGRAGGRWGGCTSCHGSGRASHAGVVTCTKCHTN